VIRLCFRVPKARVRTLNGISQGGDGPDTGQVAGSQGRDVVPGLASRRVVESSLTNGGLTGPGRGRGIGNPSVKGGARVRVLRLRPGSDPDLCSVIQAIACGDCGV
jgi:hypothetical protein